MSWKNLGAIASIILVAACATAKGTPYAPADQKGYGYEDTKIESNRYRVVFAGDGGTPPAVVEDFALLRAAELTRDAGFDWFRVIARDLSAEEKGGVGVGAGVGSGSYGRRSGVSVGVGGDLGTIGARRFFTSRLEILMGSGESPEGIDVYNAASVIESILPTTDTQTSAQ
ncbi:MAG: hypothetical protein AAFR21_02955 [Pseudomonadota bacterium]